MNMNSVIAYFDLASRRRPNGQKPVAESQKLHWLPQYLGLLAGIVIQPYFQRYMSGGQWSFAGIWGWMAASIVIALMAFPGVYKDSFDETKPLIVQLCVIFITGMGWQSLVSTALKAAGGVHQ